MKKVYLVVTPSGRSIISIRDDPRKAYHKNMKQAMQEMRTSQKRFKVKLKIKSITVPNKVYNMHF